MKKGENKGIHKKMEGESEEKRKNKEIHQERRKIRWKEAKTNKYIRTDEMKRGENKEIHKKRRWKEAKTKKYIRKVKRRESKEIHKTMD